jgi:formate hydrogenlyase subunit 3/multisubunit Na+/H+ antiporter MnhD subunit
MFLVLLAIALQLAGGIAAMLFTRLPRVATALGAGAAAVGCMLGLWPVLGVLSGGPEVSLRLSWDAAHGTFSVAIDPLSAFFLLPVLVLSALAALYGGKYLLAYRHEKPLGFAWFFFNVFVAAMMMVLIARTALLFLVAWEVMSLAAYCLVSFEHEKADVQRAGWIYLIATHLGVICLFVAFSLLGRAAGGLEFADFRAPTILGPGMSGLIFVLAVIGFGTKAGLVPFHVWLPEAHPAAPSHVSALMSGAMIKMGLYGILRIITFLGPQHGAWRGPMLAAVGLATALVGIAMALHQRDVKRALAFSSIENMGLIVLALGVSMWAAANRLPLIAVLSMAGGLLHVWNHTLMKGLMFLAAGSVMHGTRTKDMERLGGLMRRMPWTGMAMLLGAVAIAALPPLHGFVGKWLMYLGLIKYGIATAGVRGLTAILTVGMLALVGGLAGIAFVRLTGIVLLGAPRSEAAARAHESSPWLLVPMLVLLVLCLTVAIVPQQIVCLMSGVLNQVLGYDSGAALGALPTGDGSLAALGSFNAWTYAAIALAAGILFYLTRKGAAAGATWGCGYARPTPRIQYTGRSLAEMFAEHLLPNFLRPKTARLLPKGLFPAAGEFSSDSPDFFIARLYQPLFACWAARCVRLRVLQQGKTHVYICYIMLMVVLALAWVSLRSWWRTL